MKTSLRTNPQSPFAAMSEFKDHAIDKHRLELFCPQTCQTLLLCVLVDSANYSAFLNQEISAPKLIYICQGIKSHLKGLQYKGLSGAQSTFRKKTIQLAFKGVQVIHTQRRQQTVNLIEMILQAAKKKRGNLTFLQAKSAASNANLDGIKKEARQLARMLLTVKGLGLQKVKEVVREYPRLIDLMLMFEQKGQLGLSQIQVNLQTGSKRRLGKTLSQRLYRILMSMDPNQLV